MHSLSEITFDFFISISLRIEICKFYLFSIVSWLAGEEIKFDNVTEKNKRS